jgi:hypothetical protein
MVEDEKQCLTIVPGGRACSVSVTMTPSCLGSFEHGFYLMLIQVLALSNLFVLAVVARAVGRVEI